MDWQEAIGMVALVASVLCALVVVAKIMCESWSDFRSLLKALLAQVLGGACPTSVDAEFSHQVATLLTTKRLQLFRVVNKIHCYCMCLYAFHTAFAYALSLAPLKPASVLVSAGLLILHSSIVIFPGFVSGERSALAVHTLNMALLALAVFVKPWYSSHSVTGEQLVFSTLFSAGLCLRFRFVFLTNVVLEACILADSKGFVGSMSPFASDSVIVARLGFLACKLGVLFGAEVMMKSFVSDQILLRQGHCQMSAVSSLLGMCCDAVVDLDQNRLMKSHSPKLAVLLMRGTTRSLQGTSFTDFVPEGEDRQRFEELLSIGSLLPSMLALHVRDAISNLVSVELLHVPYESVGGLVHHIIGVREDGDGTRVFSTPATLRNADDVGTSASNVVAGSKARDSVADIVSPSTMARVNTGSSRRSTHTSSTAYSGGPVAEWSLVVKVEDELRILWMGSTLKALVAAQGEEIEYFGELLPDEGLDLQSWIVDQVDEIRLSAESNGEIVRMYGDIDLTLPGSFARQRLWVRFGNPVVRPDDGTIRPIGIGLGPVPRLLDPCLALPASAAQHQLVCAL